MICRKYAVSAMEQSHKKLKKILLVELKRDVFTRFRGISESGKALLIP